jgi:hypothetical protein
MIGARGVVLVSSSLAGAGVRRNVLECDVAHTSPERRTDGGDERTDGEVSLPDGW